MDLQKAIAEIEAGIAEARVDENEARKCLNEWEELLWDLDHDMESAKRNDYYHLIEDLLEGSAE